MNLTEAQKWNNLMIKNEFIKWKDIKSWPDYEISNHGLVRNKKSKKFLKLYGYNDCHYYLNNQKRLVRILMEYNWGLDSVDEVWRSFPNEAFDFDEPTDDTNEECKNRCQNCLNQEAEYDSCKKCLGSRNVLNHNQKSNLNQKKNISDDDPFRDD